ncbi:MAG: 3-oxoacyl-[acyl-carrier-protein] synthase II, partial [Saprospiraceae bacterium]
MKRVVITGIGALTPIGNNVEEFLAGLKNGVSGANLITKFDAEQFKTKFACEVKNLTVEDFIDRKEVRRLDPFAQYALISADEAMKRSGLDLEKIDLGRAGVIWGSGIGGLFTLEHEIEEFAKGSGIPRY